MLYATLLRKAVANLGLPYGAEHSFKLIKGALLQNRFLLTLHISAFGSDPQEAIRCFIKPFNMPESFLATLATPLSYANIIHLGYEQNGQNEQLKLYLEFAADTITAVEIGTVADEAMLVHVAYKWDPHNPSRRTTAYYHYQPGLGRAKVAERVAGLFAERQQMPSRFTQQLIAKTAHSVPEDGLLLLEVSEEGNPRRSFDLKLYDAEWPLALIEPELMLLFDYFQLPREQLALLMKEHSNKVLGHLSGGIGRDDREFITLYFGVEEC